MSDLTVFSVTQMGLQIDGRMIMPGSRLLIKGAPHTGWNGCGVVVGDTGEQSLQVASPRAAVVDAPVEPVEPEPEPKQLGVAAEPEPEPEQPKQNHRSKNTRY